MISFCILQQDVSIFNIPGYKLINRARSCSAHGGLVIHLKEEYTFTERHLSVNSNLWEGLFIDIQHEGLENKITLANIYRPPKDNDCNAVLTKFNDEIRTIVNQLSQENSNCIITGDTNINIFEVNERTNFQEYFDIFITNGLFPKITLPTRYNLNRNTGTLIDHLFCKLIDGENCISSLYRKLKKTGVLSPEYSDLASNLRLYNAILKKNIRLTKMNNYAEKFEKYKLDMHRTWSTITEALNKNEKKDAYPNYFMVDGFKTDSKTDIASSFNSFFANIGKNLSEKIHCATSNTIDTYLK